PHPIVSTAGTVLERAQRLRDTVNAASLLDECRLSLQRARFRILDMVPKKREQRSEPTLPFDVTQEIDPALLEDVRRNEATLTQTDSDEITLVLPENRKPRP